MCWDEVDSDAKVWIVPAQRMKAAREHRVPLSGRAMGVLANMEKPAKGALVFPGGNGRPTTSSGAHLLLTASRKG